MEKGIAERQHSEYLNVRGEPSMEKGIAERQISEYLTIRQAASMLGVSSSTLRNWDRAGKLKATRHPFNGYRLYLHLELERILKDLAHYTNHDNLY